MSVNELVEWMMFYEIDGMLRKEMHTGKSGAEALEMVRALVEIHDSQQREVNDV